MFAASDLNAIARAVRAATTAVGRDVVMPSYQNVAHSRKADGSLVTTADAAAQTALVTQLRAIVDAPVLGEEMSRAEQQSCWEAGAAALWCVDPIDGTSNFVHGVPYFAISVALLVDHRPVVGVVHAPVSGEIFHAARGGGAWLGDDRLPLREAPTELRRAMAQVDFKRAPRALSRRLVEAPPYAFHRNLGAASLEWCWLAAGRFDLYVHGGQKLWDFAAAVLILEEAGGCVRALDDSTFWGGTPWTRSVLAARDPVLFEAWRAWVRAARDPEDGLDGPR
ncbi:MAG: inositol monophosphatase [Burkholderiales bacterium]|nr:inositol monophosphatase [Burkholderiales bacterium]